MGVAVYLTPVEWIKCSGRLVPIINSLNRYFGLLPVASENDSNPSSKSRFRVNAMIQVLRWNSGWVLFALSISVSLAGEAAPESAPPITTTS